MTTSQLADLRDQPVTSVDELTALWQALMGTGGFSRRSLWLIFLDVQGVPLPSVTPIHDLPVLPGVASIEGLRAVLDELAVPSVAMLLSRSGDSTEQDSDRQWAAALTPLTPRWPLHLATVVADPAGPTLVRPLLGNA